MPGFARISLWVVFLSVVAAISGTVAVWLLAAIFAHPALNLRQMGEDQFAALCISLGGSLIVALQSLVLVWQTIKIASSVRQATRSAQAAEDTAWLTHQQFISTYRPRFRIKGIWPTGNVGVGDVFHANLIIANIGSTPARVSHLRVWVVAADYPPAPPLPDCRVYQGYDLEKKVSGGRTRVIPIKYDNIMIETVTSTSKVFCIGLIDYLDDNDGIFSAGFCRVYNPITGRMDATKDPDYEFAD